jgi:hypothetical protein
MENIEAAKDIQTGDRVQLKGGEWVTVDRWDQMASKQTLMLSELKVMFAEQAALRAKIRSALTATADSALSAPT